MWHFLGLRVNTTQIYLFIYFIIYCILKNAQFQLRFLGENQ